MITKNDILSKLKELKPFLNKEFAVRKIGLFGSFSEGNYKKIFNRKIDIVTKNALKKQIRDNILQQVNYV